MKVEHIRRMRLRMFPIILHVLLTFGSLIGIPLLLGKTLGIDASAMKIYYFGAFAVYLSFFAAFMLNSLMYVSLENEDGYYEKVIEHKEVR